MIKINLSNKLAFVTGAGGGLGKAISLDLAECGADVVLACRGSLLETQKTADEIISMGRKALVVQGDIAKSSDCKTMVEAAIKCFNKPIDILVNNAGYYQEFSSVIDITDDIIDKTIDTNLKGTIYMSREVGKAMVDSGINGRIINISSGAGHGGRKNHSHYCSSKAGVIMLTKAMAIEMAPKGVNINSISVGFVDVGRFDEGSMLTVKTDILPRILLRRPGKPADISRMVCFLASECGDWITGTDIRIDGGESAGRIPPQD